MDNEIKKDDSNNGSTQKTVRLKPLIKMGETNTESQSVKKVSTNSGNFPKVGTQTGRISTIATNTSKMVKINSTLRNTAGKPIAGPSTTMLDFKTSELQSPAANTPVTTRPAAAPKSVLSSLNLKPKVAEASVVDAAPAAQNAASDADDTKTAAVPKIPAPVKPNINIGNSEDTDDATVKLKRPERPAATRTNSVVPAIAPQKTAAPAASENDTATAAVAKPAPAVKPVININTKAPAAPAVAPAADPAPAVDTATAAVDKPTIALKPVINVNTSADAGGGDSSTVKLKRPERPAATRTNSVVPSISAKPTVATAAPAAPSLVKPSAAPTVKLNMNQSVGGASAPTVAAMPSAPSAAAPAEPPKAKLGLKKAEPPAAAAPAEEPKKEEPKEEVKKADPAAKEAKKTKKSKKNVPPAGKVKKSAAASQDMPPGFHFAVGFLAALFVLAAATFCVIQYMNTYQPRVFGRYIQIPFMEQVGK